jgi:hypothetical protein
LKRYGGLAHSRQLYGSEPSRVSTGLDVANAGESFPCSGVDVPQVWSKGLHTQDKIIRHTHGSHGVSSLQHTEDQQQK